MDQDAADAGGRFLRSRGREPDGLRRRRGGPSSWFDGGLTAETSRPPAPPFFSSSRGLRVRRRGERRRSAVPSVERSRAERRRIDAVEAADVHGDDRRAVLAGTAREGFDAAAAAEEMMDPLPAELIVRELRFARA